MARGPLIPQSFPRARAHAIAQEMKHNGTAEPYTVNLSAWHSARFKNLSDQRNAIDAEMRTMVTTIIGGVLDDGNDPRWKWNARIEAEYIVLTPPEEATGLGSAVPLDSPDTIP